MSIEDTPVSAEYGKKVKFFSSSNSNHEGTIACKRSKYDKHITAIVAVSASGRCATPCFIVAGKNVMQSWF